MKFQGIFQWVLLSALVRPSLAAVYTNPSQLKTATYDYIVIGSGAGGGAVAARLAEISSLKILVVEAGVS